MYKRVQLQQLDCITNNFFLTFSSPVTLSLSFLSSASTAVDDVLLLHLSWHHQHLQQQVPTAAPGVAVATSTLVEVEDVGRGGDEDTGHLLLLRKRLTKSIF